MSPSILEFKDVSFSYEGGFSALKSLNIKISAGERIGVIGRNGAGKSTFFLHCNGVLRPESGEILFENRRLTFSKKELFGLRQAVGIVFQEPDHQLIGPTVEGEVSFGLMNLGLPIEAVEARLEETLQALSLSHLRERPCQYLSGGEKKRVCIADILVMEPKVILFDEPTASLDSENKEILENILKKNTQGQNHSSVHP